MNTNFRNCSRRAIQFLIMVAIALAVAVLSEARSQASPSKARDVSRTPTLVFVLRERAGPYYYWRDRKVGRAYGQTVAAFDVPSARGKDAPTSNLCTVRWESIGLDVGFAGPVGNCADRDLRRGGWYGMRLWGRRWKTARGLRVGDPAWKIRQLYPQARYVSEPPKPGEWVLITESQQDLGRVPLLIAQVGAGRVTAIDVPAGFVF